MTALRTHVRQSVLVFFLIIIAANSAQPNSTDSLNISFTLSDPETRLPFFFPGSDGFDPNDGFPAATASSPAITLFAITYGQGNRKHRKASQQQASEQPSPSFLSGPIKDLPASSNSESSGTGSGADPPETPDEGPLFTSTDITFQHLIEQINQLMEKLPKGAVLTLVCDKDDTLLEEDDDLKTGSEFLRKQFTAWLNTWRSKGRLKFIVVTHATLRDNNWDHFPENHLPTPDFLVSVPPPGNLSRPAFIAPGEGLSFSGGGLLPMGFHLEGETITNLDNHFLFEKYGRFLQQLTTGQHRQALTQFFAEKNSDPVITLASIEPTDSLGGCPRIAPVARKAEN